MKKLIALAALLLVTLSAHAQKPYRVVFDVTSGDTVVHQNLIRWLTGISAAHPEAQMEVVFYGAGVDMIAQGRSVVAEGLKQHVDNPNMSFRVCEVALKNRKVAKEDLLPGIGTVPDGIYEIAQRQYDGWAYIKATR